MIIPIPLDFRGDGDWDGTLNVSSSGGGGEDFTFSNPLVLAEEDDCSLVPSPTA